VEVNRCSREREEGGKKEDSIFRDGEGGKIFRSEEKEGREKIETGIHETR